MELDLKGKSALITGSSHGIGKSIAGALHAEGCRVAINGRNAEPVNSVVAELPGSVPVVGDVSNPECAKRIIESTISSLGALDILVCNVGSGRSVPAGEESFDEWQRVFALNLWSATNVIEAARNAFPPKGGVIVCISSICGLEVIPGAPVTYSVSKAALHAYIKGIARPLAQNGIRILGVAPGNMLFEGSTWSSKLRENEKSVNDMLEREVALARLGSPKEVADFITFLVSSRASFATGCIYSLDGGQVRS